MTKERLKELRQRLHQEACDQNLESYPDPDSGLPVMTAVAHKKRGYCCTSGCRHCPYGFEKKSGNKKVEPLNMIPRYIVIHHSATDSSVTFDQIRQNHLERGWDDIGYHYVIDSEGTVTPGRAEDVVGAHALGLNQESLGVCCIGNFEEEHPTGAQVEALKRVIGELAKKYEIVAEKVIGHCDVTCDERGGKRSACPGRNLYGVLDDLLSTVSSDSGCN